MATVPTSLANSIDASDTRAKLDAVAKKLIKHRIILAEILKECIEEFKDFQENVASNSDAIMDAARMKVEFADGIVRIGG